MKKLCLITAFLLAVMSVFILPVSAADADTAVLYSDEYDPEFVQMKDNTDDPVLFVTGAEAKVGDTIQVQLLMGNAAGFTSGDFVIQYNPYRLQFEGFEASNDMNNSNVFLEATEQTGAGTTDIYGNISHEVNIAMLHMEQFPASLNDCLVGVITFKAIGGGECPLELSALSFELQEKEVKPRLNVGMVRIEGEEGSEWDYSAITSEDIRVPEGQYEVNTSKKLSTPVKVVLVVAVLLIVAVVVIFIAKGNTIVEEEPAPENENGAAGDAPDSGEKDRQTDEEPKNEPHNTPPEENP